MSASHTIAFVIIGFAMRPAVNAHSGVGVNCDERLANEDAIAVLGERTRGIVAHGHSCSNGCPWRSRGASPQFQLFAILPARPARRR
jgi:hypothetical protein